MDIFLFQREPNRPRRDASLPLHYDNQNRMNEKRSAPSPPNSRSSGNSSPPVGSYALYQSRPLPDTPQDERSNERESSLERALSNKDPTPSSPAPPGYQDPPKYKGPRHMPPEDEDEVFR